MIEMKFGTEEFQSQMEKAMRIPLGAASPLWFAYGGMAMGAATYWWLSRLAKPMNLEAMAWPKVPEFGALFETPAIAPAIVEAPPVIAPETPVPPTPEPVLAAVEPVIEALEVAAETTAKMMAVTPDDLTVLVGIGPTLASKLSDLGVKTYADIAAWTEAEVETFDKQLKLLGRITRDDWIGQAKQLAVA